MTHNNPLGDDHEDTPQNGFDWERIELPDLLPDLFNQPYCDTCLGAGWIIQQYTDGTRKTLLCPNPNCVHLAQRKAARIERYWQGIEKYRRCTLESFVNLPAGWLDKKMLAYSACKLMAQNPKEIFTLHNTFEAANIPHETVGLNAVDYPDIPLFVVYGENKRITNSIGNGLFVIGDYGTGKTGLAVATGAKWLEQNLTVKYINVPNFIEDIKRTYGTQWDGEPWYELVEPVIQADLAILDEFTPANRSQATNNELRIMQHIVTERWANWRNKPMIITGNDSLETFEQQWGGIINRSVLEMCHIIRVGGMDIRNQNDETEAL